MNDFLLYFALVLFVLAYVSFKSKKPGTIYLDTPTSRVFYSDSYRIKAKPDELSKDENNNIVLHEYKSRASGFYPSDRTQMIATAIVVKQSGHNVVSGILETGNGHQHRVSLLESPSQLYSRISDTVEQARLALSGVEPMAKPATGKCNSCAYRGHCRFSKALR